MHVSLPSIRSISVTLSYRRPYFPGVFRKLFRVSFDGRAVSGKIPGGFILREENKTRRSTMPASQSVQVFGK